MIVYSRNIGRHVPLRDLPAVELVELAKALTETVAASDGAELAALAYQVVAVQAVVLARRTVELPFGFIRIADAALDLLTRDSILTRNEILCGRDPNRDKLAAERIAINVGPHSVSIVPPGDPSATGYILDEFEGLKTVVMTPPAHSMGAIADAARPGPSAAFVSFNPTPGRKTVIGRVGGVDIVADDPHGVFAPFGGPSAGVDPPLVPGIHGWSMDDPTRAPCSTHDFATMPAGSRCADCGLEVPF